MPPPILLGDVEASTSDYQVTGHTHAPHNLTLPNQKKSPLSHLDDLDSDQWAFMRLMLVLMVIGAAISIWLLIKFRRSVNDPSSNDSQSRHNAVYKPLNTFDELQISDFSDDESEDEFVVKLAG